MKKAIFLSLLITLITFSCKKKKDSPVESNINYTGDGSYALVSRDRSFQQSGSSVYITTNIHTYDQNLIRKTVRTDSSFSGTNWTVNSNTVTYTYNANNKWSNVLTTYSAGPNNSIDYLYDVNGKLQYEITTNGTQVDTNVYTHTGAKSVGKPLYISSNRQESYYTNGDLDSSLNFSGMTMTNKSLYIYHASNINKTFLAWATAMPLHPANKELTAQQYISGGTTYNLSYTYTKNANGYPLTMVGTFNGTIFTASYSYL
jgi:hypothetical protein